MADTSYNLRALARAAGVRRARLTLAPIEPFEALSRDLERAYLAHVNAGFARARREIMEAVAVERRAYQADDMQTLRAYLDQLRGWLRNREPGTEQIVERAIFAEERRHAKRFVATIRAAVNINVAVLIAESDVVKMLAVRVQEHVRLIKSLTADVIDRIEKIAIGSVLEGRGNRETEKLLAREQDISRARAKLIARDQASKLNGSLNQYRQEQAGITTYIWQTTRDGRQRDSHDHNHDKRFRWDTPPSTGHPGYEINCRCRAQAVIDEPDDNVKE